MTDSKTTNSATSDDAVLVSLLMAIQLTPGQHQHLATMVASLQPALAIPPTHPSDLGRHSEFFVHLR
ncbi:uncharacterized protein ARMOST_15524 [Armillaria ostoyae]|uniref:Uncharacterized protein n=1 Tax=Armillaria ostoyae TaxID=47428 RepID=A0A284RTM0_ARMOS|nr:uncharacterized protein ARMOST_15524 [Armillaria ostoyae]